MPSYQERLTANNLKIDEITTLANTLPDADEINEKIDAQDTIIENLKSALDEKAGKTGGTPNIFLQTTEPTSKQGIWLQVADKEYEKVVAEDSVVTEPTWLPDGTARNIPYDFTSGSATSIGTDIYLFGGSNSSTNAYKYDTINDAYTQLTNIPYQLTQGIAVSVGTNIFLLGGYNSKTYNYKYDTLEDTYTKMTDIPYNFYNCPAVVVGTDIYLFGNMDNSNYNKVYKYNTVTDNYTQLSNLNSGIGSEGCVAVLIGTDVYLLGGGYTKVNYKYDTLTDTYTKKANISYSFQNGSAVNMGTDIYLLGGTGDAKRLVTKYNILSNTYTALSNLLNDANTAEAVTVNNKIYLLGVGSYTKNIVSVMQFPPTDFDDKSIVLLNGSTYETQLFTSELVDSSVKYPFSDVWLYEESEGGLETDIPTYYGDGTQWVNIKNPPV